MKIEDLNKILSDKDYQKLKQLREGVVTKRSSFPTQSEIEAEVTRVMNNKKIRL